MVNSGGSKLTKFAETGLQLGGGCVSEEMALVVAEGFVLMVLQILVLIIEIVFLLILRSLLQGLFLTFF